MENMEDRKIDVEYIYNTARTFTQAVLLYQEMQRKVAEETENKIILR